jgi:hypothetical protein
MAETNGTKTRRSIPEMSIDARLLTARLKQLRLDEIVTYMELSAIVGRDVRKDPTRGHLDTARKVVEREDGFVIAAVYGIGLKRLLPPAVIEQQKAVITSVNRKARRAMKKLATVPVESLDSKGREDFNTVACHMSMVAATTTQNAAKKLRNEVVKSQQQLPLAKTLDAFK